ncbi:MAG: DoxX family protein [Ginsengibacter sp.]
MTNRNKITYWVATIWLALGMVSTGIVQLMKRKEEATMFAHLGYPVYLSTILAIAKFMGVIAVLVPKFPLVKEWAYTGFFFVMAGAVLSHFAVGNGAEDFFGPVLLLAPTIISWYFRPAERKLVSVNQMNNSYESKS